MASLLTSRDIDLFRAVARGPLTTRQVLKLSETFSAPFPSTRFLQKRLKQLADDGLLRRWWYSTEGPGARAYYTLSPESSRLLGEPASAGPRAWSRVAISRQFHTQCLQEFLVHMFTAAHRAGITVAEFSPENALELSVGEKRFRPDAAFSLIIAGLPKLRYYVEIDTGTEPVRSEKERDSVQRKLEFYEQLRDTGERFRVLGVVTAGPMRMEHLIELAGQLAHEEGRTVFCGIQLDDFLAQTDALCAPQFRNHLGQLVALAPKTLAERG